MSGISGYTASPTNIISQVRTQLIVDGWSVPGTVLPYTATKTVNGKTYSFTWQAFNAAYLTFVVGGNNYYVYTGGTDAASNFYACTMVSYEDFLWLQFMGPRNGYIGTKDATYGSDTGFFCIAPFEPYWTADATAADHYIVMSSHASSSSTSWQSQGRIRKGQDGTDWQVCELATMRPAIQNQDTAVGDLIPGINQQGHVVYWDFVVVEAGTASPGIRGRLNHIYHAGDDYQSTLTGDSSVPAEQRHGQYISVNIGGVQHNVVRPTFQANVGTIGYSPIGTPERSSLYNNVMNSIGGPLTLIPSHLA